VLDPYDERPYTAHAYAETHPGRLAAAARLGGWQAPPVETARVLELGCGRGGNLLPMAASLPRATFLGIDRSERQIVEARAVAAGAGLSNVTFVQASFEEMALAGGSFDYVVCHGVLSWVPAPARRSLLERIAAALTVCGVACVSFNVLPGWYDRLAARDWLRFGASSLAFTDEGAASSLGWLRAQASPELRDYRERLAAVERRLAETGPVYAFHEYLSEDHHPQLVGAFLNDAASAGLTYAGDAIPQSVALELLPDEARTRALLLDSVDAQQLVDFVRCTAFRRALLVREDSGAHATPWPSVLDPQAIRSLFVSSRLRAHDGARADVRQESFAEGAEGGWVVQVSDPTARRALHELARNAPRSLAFDELARRSVGPGAGDDAAVALATELFDVWLATGGLDLRADAPGFATEPGERPKACPLARWQAKNEGVVTSRLHHEVLFPDAVVRWILARLDGTRTIGELAREARTLDPTGASTDAELERVVAASIERLTACALMV
jgi:SAM-dependent methyltransferase